MLTVERRFEVRLISPDALRSYMQFRGFTIRSLAKRVGCPHSTIGFLVKGSRPGCRPDTARDIAKALDCPVESLFRARVSSVTRETGRAA